MAVKSKKINELPDGTPDDDSWMPFSDKNGKAYRMPAFLGGGQDFTFKSKAVVSRPVQTNAVVELTGDMTGIGKDVPVPMVLKYSDEFGTSFTKNVNIEWQGNTSLSDPKKSYSIDLYNDKELEDDFKIKFGDWVPLESYHLKSNYTDPLAVRDVLISRMALKCWQTRSMQNAYPWSKPFDFAAGVEDVRESGARGVVDGFPIELIINGDSLGLYTWRLPRKRQNYNMDKDNSSQVLATADQGPGYSFPTSAPFFIPQYWDLKNPKFDGAVPTDVNAAMERMLSFLQSSIQADFNAHASEYFNVPLSIDYFILVLAFMGTDNRHKNLTLATYDSLIWSPCLYDCDRTIGARHIAPSYGTIVGPDVFSDINDPVWLESTLYAKLLAGFKDQMDARYAELRNSVLNFSTIQQMVLDIVNQIPYKLYEKDFEVWGGNAPHRPFGSSAGQIVDYMIGRFELLDPQFNYTSGSQALLL